MSAEYYLDKLKEQLLRNDTPSVTEKIQCDLPKDVVEFFSVFNGGCINDYIWFISPFSNVWEEMVLEIRNSYIDVKEDFYYHDSELLKMLQLKENEGYPFDFYPSENGIIPFAQCDNGTVFYLKPDPVEWTIIVYGDSWEFYEYKMSLPEFIYNLLNNKILNMAEYLPYDIFINEVIYTGE